MSDDQAKTPNPGTIFDYLQAGDIDTDRVQKDVKNQYQKKFPKKFFETATYAEIEEQKGKYQILLDNRPLKTPLKNLLVVPTEALAKAIVEEWNALKSEINPDHLPLTKTANSAIEKTAPNREHVIDELVNYADTDLLCYQQDHPAGLAAAQEMHWNPIINWAEGRFGIEYKVTYGISHVAQDDKLPLLMSQILDDLDEHELSAFYLLTTATSSVLIALAYLFGVITTEGAIKAAYVDEDWQNSQWGLDEEAKLIKIFNQSQIKSHCQYLDLLK